MSDRIDVARRLTASPVFTDAELFADEHGWEWARQTYGDWLHRPLTDAELRDLTVSMDFDSPLSHFNGLHQPSLSSWVMRALHELASARRMASNMASKAPETTPDLDPEDPDRA